MPAITIFDKLEEVPESLRDQTKEVEGKFHLDATAFTNKHNELLGENKDLKKLRKDIEKFKDVDPDEYRKLKTAAAEAANKRAKDEGNWEQLRQQLVSEHEKQSKKWDSERAELINALEEQLVTAAATGAISNAKGDAVVLLPHVSKFVKMQKDEDGKFVAVVTDGKGNPRLHGAQGKPMSIQQLVEEMRADEHFARAFDAPAGNGGGASGDQRKGGNGVVRLTRKEASDNAKYNAAMKEARERGVQLVVSD